MGLIGVLLCLALLLPSGAAHAASTQTLGCAAIGYTMQIPSSQVLQMFNSCTPHDGARVGPGNGRYLTLNVAVEYHSWWSDGRSRSSITNDINRNGATMRILKGVLLTAKTFNSRRFMTGIAEFAGSGRTFIDVEAETFYTGYLYKLSAYGTMADTAGDTLLRSIWSTIQLYPRGAPTKALPALPILGGPKSDWLRTLGAPMPNTSGNALGWMPCANGTTAGLLVTFTYNRAATITRQHCDEDRVLPIAERFIQAERYMPLDTVRHGVQSSDQDYTFWPYFSASLGHAAPDSIYQDCNGNPLPAGTFVFDVFSQQDDGTWQLVTGECP